MPIPVASFTYAAQNDGTPLTVQFTDTSTNTPTSWAWNFGDGTTSTLHNPSHTFSTIGTFTISLVATNASGSSTAVTHSITTEPSFNCDCDDDNLNETLAQLRRRMLVRLGYSAQADNPPPGMADLLDDFLVQAQRFLYRRYHAIRTIRFFTWTMTPGVRFYDIPDTDGTCTKRLDPLKVQWVGMQDANNVWYPMYNGIPPEFYTSVNFLGYPSRYEIRQCIEVFPAPAAAYKLRIKGDFGLEAFVADGDQTTIDSELVFMWALANAKAHYGQADANNVAGQADTYLKELISGSHMTARYVPGTSPAMPYSKPVFLPLQTP